MRVVGIAGSLLPGAHIRRLLEAVGRELPPPAEFEIWERLAEVPPLEDRAMPACVADLCQTLAGADGLLVAAPAHSVMPAQLGHALDWLASQHGGTALLGKPVAVVTACASPHESMWAQIQLRRALGAAGAAVQGADLATPPGTVPLDADGRIGDPMARERLQSVVAHLRSPSLARFLA
ncbi:FMN reductase [Sphaerisporangium rufum]|uniref:FMN reductase n=1 Tax=Sphaerisporangium rufum TaxID=1381558 RepID=A0A919QYP0_9ACTN|nr:NAD(P)H-dependent oxidoreductase [Sphaerisporangium rufum]GII76599.1 FMN reductase [Sphaerisporangium rufum]